MTHYRHTEEQCHSEAPDLGGKDFSLKRLKKSFSTVNLSFNRTSRFGGVSWVSIENLFQKAQGFC